jgi:hypothetical protein
LPDTYRLDPADPYADIALQNGMKIHGHTDSGRRACRLPDKDDRE